MGQSNLSPIKTNPNAAKTFKILGSINNAIEPPAKTPNRLANTRALAEAKNTALGSFALPLIAIVANWVLSPSSAKKTVANVVRKRVSMISLIQRSVIMIE